MEKEYNEIVKVYLEPEFDGEYGDFVRCEDCGCVQLISLGGTACGECEGEHLDWVNLSMQEATVADLEKLNYIIDK